MIEGISENILEKKLEALMARLKESNTRFEGRYLGLESRQQAVHTVYGGAQLYKKGATLKLARLAEQHFDTYAPNYEVLADALEHGAEKALFETVHQRVKAKLQKEAIEDHRIDFEDGYGSRSDEEEDQHAQQAAIAMAENDADKNLPKSVGIRIKALSEEAKYRSVRTMQMFITTLLKHNDGLLPSNFIVTLPKVTTIEQVAVVCEILGDIETEWKLSTGQINLELMLENVQCLFDEDGRVLLPKYIAAAMGRVSGVILGTFDYTASCNIASHFQSHLHPSADFARQMLIASLTGTDVAFSDGITNIMPIPPNKGGDLSADQEQENRDSVHAAWRLHFDNIIHSLKLGIYQGWDLNPAQIPIRYTAIYYFFLTGLDDATQRLESFVNKAAQASMLGNTFDDAATGQGLVNYFVNGFSCGALSKAEVLATGITLEELKHRSFKAIVDNRIKGT